jgi:glycosyl transferase family 25
MMNDTVSLHVNDTVKIVSLARNSTDRRRLFVEQNPYLKYEFVDAVDGSQLTETDLSASHLFEDNLPWKPGAYGLAMTFHRLWTEIAAGDCLVTIAEDDAIFRPDFLDIVGSLLRNNARDIDFLAWGYNFDSIVNTSLFNGKVTVSITFDEVSLRASVDDFLADRAPVLFPNLRSCFGTCAYSISPSGARHLLDQCFPVRNEHAALGFVNMGQRWDVSVESMGIDVSMIRCYQGMRSYFSFPPLAITKNEPERSTIGQR